MTSIGGKYKLIKGKLIINYSEFINPHNKDKLTTINNYMAYVNTISDLTTAEEALPILDIY